MYEVIYLRTILAILVLCGCGQRSNEERPDKHEFGKRNLDTLRNYYENGSISSELARVNGIKSGRTIWYRQDGSTNVVGYYNNDKLKGPRFFYDSLNHKLKYSFYNILDELSYAISYEKNGIMKPFGCSIAGLILVTTENDTLQFQLELAIPTGLTSRLIILPNPTSVIIEPDSYTAVITYTNKEWNENDTIFVTHLLDQDKTRVDSCSRTYSIARFKTMQLEVGGRESD